MQIVAVNILEPLDQKREHRVVFSDSRYNKFVVMTDEIQAVSILAPDEQEVARWING